MSLRCGMRVMPQQGARLRACEIEKLSEIAITQLQAAYTAFTHVFLHRWSYIAWTVPMTSELFHPFDDVLILRFLLAMTSQLPFSSIERELLSLPVCLGGLGVIVSSVHFSSSFLSLSRVTAPVVDHLLRRDTSCSLDVYQQMYRCKLDLRVSHCSDLSAQADLLCDRLSPRMPLMLHQNVVHRVG